MKATFDKTKNEAVFKIALTPEEWEKELENAYNRTKGKYKVHGFRPGKAPRRMIEAYYGAGVFFDAAVDLCINRVYREQLAAHPELDVFGQPDVAFEKAGEGEAFAFTITVTLNPEIKLGEYKGIKLPKIEYNVTDEDVDVRINAELRQASRQVSVDRPAANGDTVLIDYVGTVDGVEFDGGKAEKYELKLGSGTFIPGFEDGLIGAVKGENRDVKVKFPDEYHAENLKGKDAVFNVTVHDVTTEEIPELTDEFVKDRGRYETVDEYKAATRETLEKTFAARQRNERIDAAMKAITDNAECDIPEKIVAAEVERLWDEFAHQMSHYGISPEDYLKYNNSTPEKFREERKEPAARNVKMRNVMRAIIEAEKIDVTPDEVRAKLADPQYRAELEHEAHHHGGRPEEYAFNEILTDKFFDFLLANNEFVTEVKKDEPQAAKKPAAKKSTAKKAETDADGEGDQAKKPATKKASKKTSDDKKDE